MGRKAGIAWCAIGSLLVLAGSVAADETETAAMKAEIEVLKNRLNKLEGKVVSAELSGTSVGGGETGGAVVGLPSGLQGLGISGFADV